MKNLIIPVLMYCFTLLQPRLLQAQHDFSVMFFNAENFFHPSDDSLTEADNDFTPEGLRRWTFYRYHKKRAAINKMILGISGWSPPSVVCLCEIENREVLEDLVGHPLLADLQYEILHREGPDHRGMEVAMLYRPDILHCTDTSWIPIHIGRKPEATREILAAEFTFPRGKSDPDTLVCFMNHWTSKYGGEIASEHKRLNQATILADSIKAILISSPGKLVVAGGDFNEDSGSPACASLLQSGHIRELAPSPGRGSYKYQGRWSFIDHIYIAGNTESFDLDAAVWDHPFLLEQDEKYTGEKPFRTYAGYAYRGGVSDHLPLLLKIAPR